MPDLAAKIRSALDEYDRDRDKEELEERLEKIEGAAGSTFTKADLKRIMGELDDDDRDELVEALIGPERFERLRSSEVELEGAEEDAQDDDDPSTAERRTRPGRKKGMLYQWDVDEETGEVVELSGPAYIYSGEDEDDEVELPAEELEELDEEAV